MEMQLEVAMTATEDEVRQLSLQFPPEYGWMKASKTWHRLTVRGVVTAHVFTRFISPHPTEGGDPHGRKET